MLLHAGRLRGSGEDGGDVAGESRAVAGNRLHVPDGGHVRAVGVGFLQVSSRQRRHRRLRAIESMARGHRVGQETRRQRNRSAVGQIRGAFTGEE